MAEAILGLAAYPRDRVWQNVELLVRSVRLHSPRTAIVLVTAPLGDADRFLFDEYRVESVEAIEPSPRLGVDHKAAAARRREWLFELYGRRHALYRAAIEARDETHFLLADTRDVIVTAPLEAVTTVSRLVLSQEHAATPIAANHWNRDWIAEGYGEGERAALGHRPILCAGTVFGPRQAVLGYLAAMSDEVQRVGVELTQRIGDQPLHNHLAYAGQLPDFEISAAEDGWMRSIGITPFDELRFDWEPRQPPDQTPPTCLVLHQYDRHLDHARMRAAVAHAAGVPPYHRWRFSAYLEYGRGPVPRTLRLIRAVKRAITRRLMRQAYG
ncbi:MAG: hypothetical protein WCC69_09560 [Pirellulales bacterium]